jgi:hypothetical protein
MPDTYTIDPHGPWTLYTTTHPAGSTPLGTLTRSAGDTGALVQMRHGLYVQVNAGAVRTLDQRAVRTALAASHPHAGPAGLAPEETPMTPAESKAHLQRIRAEQDAVEALSDAVKARISPEEWQALIAFNTYCATRLGLTLEWYQRTNGDASYRFRPRTGAERQDWADGLAEDTR